MSERTDIAPGRSERSGILAAIGAFSAYGVYPAFFKLLQSVAPAEVLAHRVFWTAVLLAPAIGLRHKKRPGQFGLTRRRAALLCLSGLLLAINWLVFIHAVQDGQVLQSSLAYFMTPLVSVFFGAVLLRESMTRRQAVAVGLAACGVAILVIGLGALPLPALIMAATFAAYGLLRKINPVDAVTGLFVETGLLAPLAFAYYLYLESTGKAAFLAAEPGLQALLFLAGPVTGLPLLLFAVAVRRARLSTVGLLQYLVPSGHFVLAVAAFGEPFSVVHGIAFGFIWTALAVFSWPARRPRIVDTA